MSVRPPSRNSPPTPSLSSFSSTSYSVPSKSPLTAALHPFPKPLPPSQSTVSTSTGLDAQSHPYSSSPLSSSPGTGSDADSAAFDDDTPSPSLSSLAPVAADPAPSSHHRHSSSLSSLASTASTDSAIPTSVAFHPTPPPAPHRLRPPKPHHRPPTPLHLPPVLSRLSHFTLYETRARYYLFASDHCRAYTRLLKLDRSSSALSLTEDPTPYTADEAATLLSMIRSSNAATGGVLSSLHCRAVLGFVRFLLGYYLYVVTDAAEVARLGAHVVHSVHSTQLIPLTHPSVYDSGREAAAFKRHRTAEQRYKALFLSLDLSRAFYFSHTYDLTHTLQLNMVAGGQGRAPHRVKAMYVWNQHLRLRPPRPRGRGRDDDPLCVPLDRYDWCCHLLHGYVEQTTLSVLGRALTLTVVARRSRHFAGTRYLKRGINNRGQAANDVETEQLLHDRASGDPHEGQYVAYVSMRGSIPVHWTQESSAVIAQPAIVIQKADPLHRSTRLHLQDVWRRYGSPVLALNLVKQAETRKRESTIGAAYGEAVEFLNQWMDDGEHRVDYLAWDFKQVSKSKAASVMDELTVIAHWALQRTGLFHSRPKADARLITAASTRGLKPTRESLRDFGLDGLPPRQRLPDKKDGEEQEEGEEEKERTETDSARLRGEERRDRSARSPGDGGEYSGLMSPASAPFALSSIREERHSGRGVDSAREFDALSRSARQHSRSWSEEVNASSLQSLSPSSVSSSLSGGPGGPHPRQLLNHAFLQRGVLRANCVDSLDRTNAASYCLGRTALGYQLHALSLIPSPVTDSLGAIGTVLLDLYERMGDAISLQYGGSQMHRQVKGDAPPPSASPALLSALKAKQPKELITSIVRHYQNSFQDTSKQDAYNLFLGLYRPSHRHDGLHLWELGSDYYLHNPPADDNDDPSAADDEDRRLRQATLAEDAAADTSVLEEEGVEGVDSDDERAVRDAAYDDRVWWQRPILDNERSQGPFAAPPAVLFPSSLAAAPHPIPLPSAFSASTPVLPTAFPPPDLHPRAESSPAQSLDPSTDDAAADDAATLSPAPLPWVLSYGPLTRLTEFDALLALSPSLAVRPITILGVDAAHRADTLELQSREQREMATTLDETPRTSTLPTSISSPPPTLAPPPTKPRSRRSRRASTPPPPPPRPEWEAEASAGRGAAEERRRSFAYSLGSPYALPLPHPLHPPSLPPFYAAYTALDLRRLLVPQATVDDCAALLALARAEADSRRELSQRRAREKAELDRLQRQGERKGEERRGRRESTRRLSVVAVAASVARATSALARQRIGAAGLALAARKVSVEEEEGGEGGPRLSSFVVSVEEREREEHDAAATSDGQPRLRKAGAEEEKEVEGGEESPSFAQPPAPSPSSVSSDVVEEAGLSDADLPLEEEHLVLFRLYATYLRSSQLGSVLWKAAFRAHQQAGLQTELLRGGRADDAYRASESDFFSKYISLC